MKKFLTIVTVIVAAALLVAAMPWTTRQDKAHKIANLARELGMDDDSTIIREASLLWWFETDDCRMLANVVAHEAPFCTDRHQQLVAQVVLNRVADDRFPSTIKDVIEQSNIVNGKVIYQYHPSYTRELPDYMTAGSDTRRCFMNAALALMGEVDCPSEVIFQSEYESLGAGTYERIEVNTGAYRSVTYFNYG